jgi:hypothetical protein
LCYRSDATLLEARPLFRLRPDDGEAKAEIALRPLASRFRLALQAAAPDCAVEVALVELVLEITRPIYA